MILRAFVRRTSYTPDDDMVWIGPPPMRELIPEHDEVHISVLCTSSCSGISSRIGGGPIHTMSSSGV